MSISERDANLEVLLRKFTARIAAECEEIRRGRERAACPKAEAIMENNRPPEPLGAAAVFGHLGSPEQYKRKAAEAIICLRRNRETLKLMGRNWRASDARFLRLARECRLRALEVELGLRPLAATHIKTSDPLAQAHIDTVQLATKAIFGRAA